MRFLLLARRAHADAQQIDRAVHGLQPGHQPGLRAGAAGGVHQVVDAQPAFGGLVDQFQRGVDIAERADRGRTTAGDDVGTAAVALPGARPALPSRPACRRRPCDVRQWHRAAGRAARCRFRGSSESVLPVRSSSRMWHCMPSTHRSGRGLAGMVRLRRALRDDDVGLVRQRIGHQELELAGLVAAGRQTGAVVTLDPQPRATERTAQVLHRLERGRQVAESDAGKTGDVQDGLQWCFWIASCLRCPATSNRIIGLYFSFFA